MKGAVKKEYCLKQHELPSYASKNEKKPKEQTNKKRNTPPPKNWLYQLLARMKSNRNSIPDMGMQNGTLTLEHSFADFYKCRDSLIVWSCSCILRYLPKWLKTMSTPNLYVNVYSSLIYNQQILEAVDMFFNRRIKWYVHIVGYQSVIKMSELSAHLKARMNIKSYC